MIKIESINSKILKHVRQLCKKNYRDKHSQFVLEGLKLVNEAIEYRRDFIVFIVVSDKLTNSMKKMLDGLEVEIYTVEEGLFSRCSKTQSPQGILAVLRKFECVGSCGRTQEMCFKKEDGAFYLVLDRVADPGNMGTSIRTAEAAGVDCVVLVKGCADIYNLKVLRAAMGSVFRVKFKFISQVSELLFLKERGFCFVGTSLSGTTDLYEACFTSNVAVVIGSEAFGVSKEILKMCDFTVKIDMANKVESLNAAVAAGIVLFEVKRRRSVKDNLFNLHEGCTEFE